MNATCTNLVSGLGGAVIGGAATIWAQFTSIDSQRKRDKESEEILILGFVQAIADEVTSLWDRYEVEIGPHLRNLPDGDAAIVFPLQQSYFVVFDSSAHLLGRIPDRKLREQIIATYTGAKGFVDSMRYYERLVDSYNQQKAQPVQTAQQKFVSVLKPVRDAKLYAPLVDYSNQLKVAHARLEDRSRELRQLLKAFLDAPSF